MLSVPAAHSSLSGRYLDTKRILSVVANSNNAFPPVLILGESGTGKTRLAQQIHDSSQRFSKPFVTIDCTSIPEKLIEAELFGYERGAFTDAREQKLGLLELAEEGTIFFDEIGELNFSLQSKLLKVLEEKKFRRVGGRKDIHFNACIITATNQDLKGQVEKGAFRLDLFYRLNVLPVYLPPLRDRISEIADIAGALIDSFQYRQIKTSLSRSSIRLLSTYSWPGNIRDLKNILERIMLLYPDVSVLSAEHIEQELDLNPTIPPPPSEDDLSLANLERHYVESALRMNNNNQSKASKILGISRFSLRNRMKKYGLL